MDQQLESILGEEHLRELETLTDETFMLWDEVRVGFSWRYYYMEHVLRVRANSLVLAMVDGGNLRALAYAATLHDITKRYDGPIKLDDQGQRVVNADGMWINEPAQPARRNEVTEIYHRLNLYEQVHHDSGASVAAELLAKRGFAPAFCDEVAHLIRGHLRPANPPYQLGGPDDPYGDAASNALYDADTTDANLGHVAFYRNIQIHGHNAIKKQGKLDLREYAGSVARWVESKRAFVDSRLSRTGKAVAEERHAANAVVAEWLAEEVADEASFAVAERFGMLALINYFLQTVEDPYMSREVEQIKKEWLPKRKAELAGQPEAARAALSRVERFLRELDQEAQPPVREERAAG